MKMTELAKQIFTNNHVRASEGNTDSVGKPGGVALAQRKPIRPALVQEPRLRQVLREPIAVSLVERIHHNH